MEFQPSVYGMDIDPEMAMELGTKVIGMIGGGIQAARERKEAERLAKQRALEQAQLQQMQLVQLKQQEIEAKKAVALQSKKDKARTQMLLIGGVGLVSLLAVGAVVLISRKKK